MPGETILVADRNRKFLEKTEEILKRAGYEAVLARDGEEAIELLHQVEPALVLVGASLPGRSGYQVARKVKSTYDATVPCVLLYSVGEERAKTGQIDPSIENWLVRPLKRTELLACVRAMLAVRRLKQKVAQLRSQSGEVTDEPRAGARKPTDGLFDPDTGFYTFKVFKEVLFREVKRAKRHRFPLSIALIAFDAADEISGVPRDEGTHARLFGGLGLAVRRSIRDIDLPVSYSPENVLVLMPHTEVDGAKAVAQRVQQRINASSLKVGDVVIRPTVSIGLACSSALEEITFGELMKSASRALTDAVKAGGNRIGGGSV